VNSKYIQVNSEIYNLKYFYVRINKVREDL